MARRMVLGAAGVAVLTLVLGVAAGLYLLIKYLSIDRIGGIEMDRAEGGEPRNYLVVGSDVRSGDEAGSRRSDTIMVVRIDPGSSQAAVLSIPRDLVVPIAGTGQRGRINSAYSVSRSTLMDTIRDSVGIDLHHYVEIDFESFAGLVDWAGGVPLWFGSAVKDDQSGLYVDELGCVVLDGEQALAFVRSRELQYMTEDGRWSRPDPTADLGRIERQQVFVRRVLAEAVGRARSSPARIPQLVDRAASAVAIDEKLSIRDLIGLANKLRDFDPDDLRAYSLPVVETGDGATVAIDQAAADPVLDYFRGVDLEEVDSEMVTVHVRNGSYVPGQAAEVSSAFRRLGFKVTEPETSTDRYESTVVYHRPGDERFARRLVRHMGVEPGSGDGMVASIEARDDLGLAPGEVIVVTGKDFTKVHAGPTPFDVMPLGGIVATRDDATTTTANSAEAIEASELRAPAARDDEPSGTEPAGPLPPPSHSNIDSPQFIVGDAPQGQTC